MEGGGWGGRVQGEGPVEARRGGPRIRKPESITLPGFRLAQPTDCADASQATSNYRRSIHAARAAVLAAGFEPARAFAQTLARRPRLPFPPRRHQAVADHDRAEAPERAPRKCYRAAARG